jgi:hypothetical protein
MLLSALSVSGIQSRYMYSSLSHPCDNWHAFVCLFDAERSR